MFVGQVISTPRQRARRAAVATVVASEAFNAHVAAERQRREDEARRRELRRAEIAAEKEARSRRASRTSRRASLGRSRSSLRVEPVAVPAAGLVCKAERERVVEPVEPVEPQSQPFEADPDFAYELGELIAAQACEMAQEQDSGWVDTMGEYREPMLSCAGELVDDQAWVVSLLSTDPRVFAPVSDRWSDGWWTEPGALDHDAKPSSWDLGAMAHAERLANERRTLHRKCSW